MKEDFDRDAPSSTLSSFNAPNRHPTLKGLTAQRAEDIDLPFQDDNPASRNGTPTAQPEDAPVSGISSSVKGFTSKLTAVKSVPLREAFNALHPTVKRDLVRLCDFADNAFEFEQNFRLFCLNNPLFLPQVSILLEKREVKAKITANDPVDEGWCVEDSLEEVFNPDTRTDVALHVIKTSGEEIQCKTGTVKKIPLRNILPYNLK